MEAQNMAVTKHEGNILIHKPATKRKQSASLEQVVTVLRTSPPHASLLYLTLLDFSYG